MYSLDTVTCVSLLTFTRLLCHSFCFFNDTATPEIYTYCHTLSLHDALPIWVIAKGLPASPGAACGQAVFDADTAERLAGQNHDVILVRTETSPEDRSEEHTSELQSLMRISYAVFCLKKKKKISNIEPTDTYTNQQPPINRKTPVTDND